VFGFGRHFVGPVSNSLRSFRRRPRVSVLNKRGYRFV
jgi:hypothetical protein